MGCEVEKMGNRDAKKIRGPVAQEAIFKVMMTMTLAVGSVFFLKNILSGATSGAVVVGVCLLVFSVSMFLMRQLRVSQFIRQYVLCICLVLLVFIISMNSGTYYSDDFPLFLAVLCLSGMYLEPLYTVTQTILVTIVLVILYVIHPEKADPLGQYIMCVGLLDVAALSLNMVIKRGRAFIRMSNHQAEEATQMVATVKRMGEELKENYTNSAKRMEGMKTVNRLLEKNTDDLLQGSSGIQRGTDALETACGTAHERVRHTEGKIENLNHDLKRVESTLAENQQLMTQMTQQLTQVREVFGSAKEVFNNLQMQIHEINQVTNQMGDIAFNTKLLALNASVEAARAGVHGAGFSVVAAEVQHLAIDSDTCSGQVSKVVDAMKRQITLTSAQLADSEEAIMASQKTLDDMAQSVRNLNVQFEGLYQNIAEQNENVMAIDNIFDTLTQNMNEMSLLSNENKLAVDSIVAAIDDYKTNTNQIVEDSKQIQRLSAAMLEGSEG